MKPTPYIVSVPVEYWDCGNPDHKHKKEIVAQACIEKRERRVTFKAGISKWTNRAYAEVLKQHRDGARICDLARSLSLSPTRMRQVIATAKRLEQKEIDADRLLDLSIRVQNCLRGKGLNTIEKVREALEEGRLDDVPNLGEVSKNEIRKWLLQEDITS